MTADLGVALLIHYSFDLGGYTASEIVARWLKHYSANWIRLAVIEALYQGRYKAISVEQILTFWSRREQAVYRFRQEFERLVCNDVSDAGAAEKTLVQFFNGTTNIVPPQTHKKSHQTSDKKQMQCRRSPVQASHSTTVHPPIQQFIPEKADGCDFYAKLKAIAYPPQ